MSDETDKSTKETDANDVNNQASSLDGQSINGEKVPDPDSKVFWDDAKTTICHQQHPRVPTLKTQVEFQYKFESGWVFVRTTRYMMTTRFGVWKRGNIHFRLNSAVGAGQDSPDAMIQDERWHSYDQRLQAILNVSDSNLYTHFLIQVNYDGTNNDTEPDEGWGIPKPLARTPTIDFPASGIEVGVNTPLIVKGKGGLVLGSIQILFFNGVGWAPAGSKLTPAPDGSWTTAVILPVGAVAIVAEQTVVDEVSNRSNRVGVNIIIRPPEIIKPAINEVTDYFPVISGTGLSGATVKVWQTNPQRTLITGAKVLNGTWFQQSEVKLEQGLVTIRGNATLAGLTSADTADRTFIVQVLVPTITSPPAETIQDMTFTISGKEGLQGVFVKILLDLSDDEVGRSGELSGDAWSASVQVPAGRRSFVAQQIRGSQVSNRSEPVSYKIRPPIPEVKVNLDPPPGTVRFHGDTGYNGATVQVIIVKGPGGTPPPMVVVKDKQWATMASGWPYGDYEINVIQKVPGGANDWIESKPSVQKLTVPVLPPTATYVVNERIPRFSGTGINNATISITDYQGNPVGVSDTTVSGGTWSVTATSPWVPANDRVIWVVQKIGVHSSQPFVLNVTVDPLETPEDVAYRIEAYKPVFSGKGVAGATVYIQDERGVDVAQPLLLDTTAWTISAKDIWGPTDPARHIRVLQKKDGFDSNAVMLEVSIALLAPEITEIADVPGKDLYVRVRGTGWSGATITLTFNDSSAPHTVEVQNGMWAFERTTPFVPAVEHTATVIQKFGGQASPAASKTFETKLPTPTITDPGQNDDRWRDLTVKGGNGCKGASLQVYDAQFGHEIGDAKMLDTDGAWSVDLTGLPFRTTEIKAVQSLNNRDSRASDSVKFYVTVLPPEILVPIEGGHPPRTSTLSGRGVPGARVTVLLQGMSEPLLAEIPVNSLGMWSETVILPVGVKVIRCRQYFQNITSKDSPLRTYDVVPAAPVIETPVAGEHSGRRVVVSGFGVPGDRVTVTLGNAAQPISQSSLVLDDRTWSVTLETDHPGGIDNLRAVASLDGFASDSAERAVLLGTYLPSVDVPSPGQWVSHPVTFSGRGRAGIGQVVSWFNPEQVWLPGVPVTAAGWQGGAHQALPPGGQWCRFRQTLTDGADGATLSDWVDSGRFENKPPAT